MTVTSAYAPNQYVGDGIQTQYQYTWLAREAAWINVLVDGVPSADFSVDSLGDPQGGTITFGTAPTGDITIYRDSMLLQETDYSAFQAFPTTQLETDLDDAAISRQELKDDISRTIRVAPGAQIDLSGLLLSRNADDLKGKLIYFDSVTGDVTLTPAADLDITTVDAQVLGQALYPVTIRESGLTVEDSTYPEGYLLRYIPTSEHAAILDFSSTLDIGPILEDVAAVMPVRITRGKYRTTTNITVANPMQFDEGAVLERSGGAVVSLSGTHPEYSVFSAGAIGDGVADDTAALQSALDTAGLIYFGDDNSVFKITSRLEGVSNTKIRGRGKITSAEEIDLLIFVSATVEEIPDTVNFEVDGLSFEHTTPGGTDTSFFDGHGFLTWRSQDVVVRNCKFININSRAVDLKLTVNTLIENCRSVGNGFTWSGDVNAVGGEVYSINTCQGTKILNCIANGGGSNSISSFRSDDLIISNNLVTEAKRSGINQTGNAVPAATNTVASLIVASDVATVVTDDDNEFLDGSYVQIQGITGGAAAINRDRPYRITRTGVDSFTFETDGVADQTATGTITARLTGGQNCVYSNNVIEDSWGGLLIENEAHGAVVANNTMRNMRNNFGVQIAGGHGDAPTATTVTGNAMLDCQGGIVILGAPGCVVSSNTIERARVVGIRMDNASSGAQNTACSVIGNTIRDCIGDLDPIGIEVNASSDCSFTNNVISNVETVGIQLNQDSDRNIVSDNLIYEPSRGGVSAGIQISNGSDDNKIDDNKISAGSHTMPFGINLLTGSTNTTGSGNRVDGQSNTRINHQDAAGGNLLTGTAPKVYQSAMGGTETFGAFTAEVFLLDPGGSARNFNPVGNFGHGSMYRITNQGASPITFGSSPTILIAGNSTADLVYVDDTTGWVRTS